MVLQSVSEGVGHHHHQLLGGSDREGAAAADDDDDDGDEGEGDGRRGGDGGVPSVRCWWRSRGMSEEW